MIHCLMNDRIELGILLMHAVDIAETDYTVYIAIIFVGAFDSD